MEECFFVDTRLFTETFAIIFVKINKRLIVSVQFFIFVIIDPSRLQFIWLTAAHAWFDKWPASMCYPRGTTENTRKAGQGKISSIYCFHGLIKYTEKSQIFFLKSWYKGNKPHRKLLHVVFIKCRSSLNPEPFWWSNNMDLTTIPAPC